MKSKLFLVLFLLGFASASMAMEYREWEKLGNSGPSGKAEQIYFIKGVRSGVEIGLNMSGKTLMLQEPLSEELVLKKVNEIYSMKTRRVMDPGLVIALVVMSKDPKGLNASLDNFELLVIETKQIRADGDLKVLKIAIDNYYKNHEGAYPPAEKYQDRLLNAKPQILTEKFYDPYGVADEDVYVYSLSKSRKYYVVYSKGPTGKGYAAVDDNGVVKVFDGAIWQSNGHLDQ